MPHHVINRLLVPFCCLLLGGCQVEFSNDFSTGKNTMTAAALASRIEADFTPQAGGATLRVMCPAGLTGEADRTFLCTGLTSDGYALDIEILERGSGTFRWLVVKSTRAPGVQPLTQAQTDRGPAEAPVESADGEPARNGTIDDRGRRCVTIDTGYVCLE